VRDGPCTGGLDPSAIRSLERVLKRLADSEDGTVVIASQIPELVEAVADRVAIIGSNRIAALGTIDELRDQYDCDGPLADVFERIAGSQDEDEVDAYLQAGTG